MSTTSKSRQARRKGKQPIGAKSTLCPWVGGYRQADLSWQGIAKCAHTHTIHVPGAMTTREPSRKELVQKGIAPMQKWSRK
jgi:hypothetical protein